MSLLTVIQDVSKRLNQPVPSFAFANADLSIQQFVALAQDVGDELAERYFWRALNATASFTVIATVTNYSLPADFNGMSPGMAITSTATPYYPPVGPVTNEFLNTFKSLNAVTPFSYWRLIGPQIEFYPVPTTGDVLKFSYYSTSWITPFAGGSAVSRWQADGDTCLIDEKVLSTGIEWRWLAAKGLDYAEAFRRFEMRLDRAAGRDDTARDVSTARQQINTDNMFFGTITAAP